MGHSNGRWILLLWCLTGVQFRPGLSTDTEDEDTTENSSEEGLDLLIAGPDYVTVGVPCNFECSSPSCPAPQCTYSMAVYNQASGGQVLSFTPRQWAESLTVTCTTTDELTGETETTTKRLQVLAGPANISISGPNTMSPMASHTYSCQVYCRPSCNFTWKIDDGPWVAGQGNVIAVTPQQQDTAKTLLCKATNTVSGLFAAKVRDIGVTFGPSEVHINGPDTIKLNKSTKFVCLADCEPLCRYMWTVNDNHKVKGSEIEVTLDRPLESFSLKCEAHNTLTRKSAIGFNIIRLERHSSATRPEERSTLLLCAFIVSAVMLI